ncbi:FG-GAP repeat protein [Candidatus Sumerlaeota bacterium]|nr:FG-GAP repeat protein [Candidatus Sumerlaeota bacterium]
MITRSSGGWHFPQNFLHPAAGIIAILLVAGMAPLFAEQIIQIDPPNPENQGLFGNSVCGVPDVNGDGYGDIIVGAYNETAQGFAGAGRIYIYNGFDGGLIRTIESPNAMTGGRLGDGLRGIPDINGDGRGDIFTSGRNENAVGQPAESGIAYVFSGATGALIRSFISPNPEAMGHFGDSVAYIKDVTGDGIEDLLINGGGESPGASPSGAGRGYLMSGANGALVYTFVSPNEELDGRYSNNIDSVPDLDGDGKEDIIVPADGETVAGLKGAGRLYIYSGVSRALVRTVNTPNPELDGQFGWSDWGMPDINGDGRGDILIGAIQETPAGFPSQSGRVYVISGATGAILRTIVSPFPSAGGMFGFALTHLPAFDNDAVPDFIIGGRKETEGNFAVAGHVYIFSGATGNLVKWYRSPNLQVQGQFGIALDYIPNGSGGPNRDFAVGAIEKVNFRSGAGRAYIYHFPAAADESWNQYQ